MRKVSRRWRQLFTAVHGRKIGDNELTQDMFRIVGGKERRKEKKPQTRHAKELFTKVGNLHPWRFSRLNMTKP